MLSIDRVAERERKRAAFINDLLMWVIGLSVLCICLGIIVLLLMTHAQATTVCLTKKEARQLWPRQHIYWYSKDHCWSNRRGPPRNLKFDPVFSKAHAEAPKSDRENAPPATKTVRVIPITKWKNDFEDYCCWPPMEEAIDMDRERERAFRLLAEKMRAHQ